MTVFLRWILAVVAGVVAYWVALLFSLGLLAMVVQKVATPVDVGHSVVLLSASLFAGTFAACLAATAVVPRAQWRTMAIVALAVSMVWAIYGQVSAGHGAVEFAAESIAAIVGAAAAYASAWRLFGR